MTIINKFTKLIITMNLLLLIAITTGCKNRKLSNDVYDECKKAVNIANKYLDFEISKTEAQNRYDRIYCIEEDDNRNDMVVCAQISLLEAKLSSLDNNDSEIKESVKELKESCGL